MLPIHEPAVVYWATVRFKMNTLRTGGWSDFDGLIYEPETARSQYLSLLARDLRRISSDHLRNLIYGCQSYIKSSQ